MVENAYIYKFGETLFLIIYSINERKERIVDSRLSNKTNFK